MNKRLSFCIFSLLLFFVSYILFLYWLFPNKVLYGSVILTDSMEPVLPVYTLVFVEPLSQEEEPKQGDMIMFETIREGQAMIITHYYDHTEEINGTVTYFTHAYGKEELDPFPITKAQIKGIVTYAISYAGKYILYLKSTIGQLTVFIDCLILIVFEWLSKRFCD